MATASAESLRRARNGHESQGWKLIQRLISVPRLTVIYPHFIARGRALAHSYHELSCVFARVAQSHFP